MCLPSAGFWHFQDGTSYWAVERNLVRLSPAPIIHARNHLPPGCPLWLSKLSRGLQGEPRWKLFFRETPVALGGKVQSRSPALSSVWDRGPTRSLHAVPCKSREVAGHRHLLHLPPPPRPAPPRSGFALSPFILPRLARAPGSWAPAAFEHVPSTSEAQKAESTMSFSLPAIDG